MSFQAPYSITDMARLQMQQQSMNQQAQQQLFDNIGGAIDNLFGAYLQREEKVAKGKAMKNVFGVIAPSLGMDENTLKQLTGELKNPMDWYNFGEQVAPMLPSMINATLAKDRMQQAPVIQAQRTTDQRNLMYEREQLARERQMMNTPQTPPPITVPTGMRRFNTGGI